MLSVYSSRTDARRNARKRTQSVNILSTFLEPLREKLNASFGKEWQEWEIPREAVKAWPEPARNLHADWWQARIARQKSTDASFAAKAEFEYLYDKPYDDKKKVRVAGPFTVESLSPHRMLGVDENDELIDTHNIERMNSAVFRAMAFPIGPSAGSGPSAAA